MDGVYYLLFLIGILVVIRWCVVNDKPGEPTHGIFAMRDPDKKAKAAAEKIRAKQALRRQRWTLPGDRQ